MKLNYWLQHQNAPNQEHYQTGPVCLQRPGNLTHKSAEIGIKLSDFGTNLAKTGITGCNVKMYLTKNTIIQVRFACID